MPGSLVGVFRRPLEAPLTTSDRRLFARGSFLESSRVAEILRTESIGGALVIAAALVALVWANTPWASSYDALRDLRVGPHSLHLDLSLATWAADGLLAIFFFVAGLELKREFVAGDLRDPRRAALPVAAAVGGMAAPAAVYVAVNLAFEGDLSGWAVPTATDIAFAVAVLAVISTHLPSGLRTFLLTLAVVDDLLAITVIAVFYTDDLRRPTCCSPSSRSRRSVFSCSAGSVTRCCWCRSPWSTWALVHESGVHATVAGVLLGFTVPVLNRRPARGEGARRAPGAPGPAGLGRLRGPGVRVLRRRRRDRRLVRASADALRDPIALGVVAGLVLGKPIGIVAATWLLHTFTHADLDDELAWTDVVGMAMLAGIGFTVSLLIGELAYPPGSAAAENVKVGVIVGSVVAALLAGAGAAPRNRVYQRLCALEEQDNDHAPQSGSVIRLGQQRREQARDRDRSDHRCLLTPPVDDRDQRAAVAGHDRGDLDDVVVGLERPPASGPCRVAARRRSCRRAVAHVVGERLVDHPRQGRVVLDVARDHEPQHLRRGQDRDRVVVLVDHDERRPADLREHPGGLGRRGVCPDGGIGRGEIACLHLVEATRNVAAPGPVDRVGVRCAGKSGRRVRPAPLGGPRGDRRHRHLRLLHTCSSSPRGSTGPRWHSAPPP